MSETLAGDQTSRIEDESPQLSNALEATEQEARTTNDETGEVAPSLRAVPLEQLAQDIQAADETAERRIADSLIAAQRAGVLLIEAQRRLRYKGFLKWVQDTCGIPRSTCYLYIEIAKGWNRLGDFQRVGKLSLREAVQLVRLDDDEEHEIITRELVALGILDSGDLNDLGMVEGRMLVAEVHKFYISFCTEVDDTVEAMRAARGWTVNAECDRLHIRYVVHDRVLPALKDGKISPAQIGKRLNPAGYVVQWGDEPKPKTTKGVASGGSSNSGGARHTTTTLMDQIKCMKRYVREAAAMSKAPRGLVVETASDLRQAVLELETEAQATEPYEWYVQLVDHFVEATCGLLAERKQSSLVLYDGQRSKLLKLLAKLRRELSLLERRAREQPTKEQIENTDRITAAMESDELEPTQDMSTAEQQQFLAS